MICTDNDCDRPTVARGLCDKHYQRARKAGMKILPRLTLAERFWPKVAKTESCWLWQGASIPLGYGQIKVDGKVALAHRVAYQMLKGPIGPGLDLDHLCRTPACVNPDHLEPVTHRVNVLRGTSPAARQARQTQCHQGHPLTGDNLKVERSGKRRCRECDRARQRARSAARALREAS